MAAEIILARRQIRLAAKEALVNARLGMPILSPGDWNTPPEDLPVIMLRSTGDQKQAVAMAQPNFETTVTLEIEAKLEGASDEEAQDDIEALGARIEQVLFTDYALSALVQKWASVQTRTGVSSEGRKHVGAFKMLINVELFEEFDAYAEDPAPAFEGANIHVDTAMPFDPTGAYENPPFPAAVNPEPRTSGPDGRDEGGLTITLPT